MNKIEQTRSALAALFPEQEPTQAEPMEAEGEEAEESVQDAVRMPGVIITEYAKHGSHLDVLCTSDQLVAVAQVLDKEHYFLESIAGVDWIKEDQLEVVYDFTCYDERTDRVTVRAFIPRDNPTLPTLTGVTPAANWHERETFDFYGVIFEGHPDLTRILLPEDADFFPLLKDYMP
ncbi:MAG: NADH-quinone oxidoreductase subunit C [Desulfobulbus propionicus]|nr:MAG: NADH-quinone oxidoreductase subunit C [Desulfobulbus propionicus]PIE63658.1 MAG: NADH-quinone oxidoreductase subunit C [Desulfobacterales bacterium]